MKIQGKKLVGGESLHKDTEYLHFEGAEKGKEYRILVDGKEYKLHPLEDKLMFKIPERKPKIMISLCVYNNGEFLYPTNVVEIVFTDKVQERTTKVIKDENKRLEDLISSQQIKLENIEDRFNAIPTSISTKDVEDIVIKNIHLENISEKINNATKDFVGKNIIKGMQDTLFQHSQDVLILKNKLENCSKVNVENNRVQSQTENSIKSINNDMTKLNDSLTNIKNNISILAKDIENLNKIPSKYDKYFVNIEQTYRDFSLKTKDLEFKLNAFEIDIKETKLRLQKIDNSEETNKKISNLTDTINKIIKKQYIEKQDFEKTIEKFATNEKIESLDCIKIPLKFKAKPFVFIGKDREYVYNKSSSPIGISNDNGELIIRGRAKVKYIGDINIGDYLYGNQSSIGESHNIGYMVVDILSDDMCEVLI